jgi:hypothetical protein
MTTRFVHLKYLATDTHGGVLPWPHFLYPLFNHTLVPEFNIGVTGFYRGCSILPTLLSSITFLFLLIQRYLCFSWCTISSAVVLSIANPTCSSCIQILSPHHVFHDRVSTYRYLRTIACRWNSVFFETCAFLFDIMWITVATDCTMRARYIYVWVDILCGRFHPYMIYPWLRLFFGYDIGSSNLG